MLVIKTWYLITPQKNTVKLNRGLFFIVFNVNVICFYRMFWYKMSSTWTFLAPVIIWGVIRYQVFITSMFALASLAWICRVIYQWRRGVCANFDVFDVFYVYHFLVIGWRGEKESPGKEQKRSGTIRKRYIITVKCVHYSTHYRKVYIYFIKKCNTRVTEERRDKIRKLKEELTQTDQWLKEVLEKMIKKRKDLLLEISHNDDALEQNDVEGQRQTIDNHEVYIHFFVSLSSSNSFSCHDDVYNIYKEKSILAGKTCRCQQIDLMCF